MLVAPVGIKVGPRDKFDIPDKFLTPQAELETIPNAGHTPQNETPEAFVERVTRFALN